MVGGGKDTRVARREGVVEGFSISLSRASPDDDTSKRAGQEASVELKRSSAPFELSSHFLERSASRQQQHLATRERLEL